MKEVTSYLKQAAQAEEWHRALTDAKRLRELAAKHNVTITMPIHDEMIVEGKAEDIEAFAAEYTEWHKELLKR